jgi:geranylgeranyl diphosphate synthase type I
MLTDSGMSQDYQRLPTLVQDALRRFLDERLSEAPTARDASLLEPVVDLLLRGGKRLRAQLCLLGWSGTGASPDDDAVRASAVLELLHGCALIHDDVMDRSATRRGGPAVHRIFAERHVQAGLRGDSGQFGMAAAIAAGDLCLVWADRLLRQSGLPLPVIERARPVYDSMRAETIRGQYLDLLTQAEGSVRTADALAVALAKTAACTTSGPLRFGGTLAGAGAELLDAYDAYGAALGTAFQLRDDLLGAFADARETGKPSGDDLRDGKCTVLLAEAFTRLDGPGADRLRTLISQGSDGAVDGVRMFLEQSGARAAVESRIKVLGAQALAALEAAPLVGDTARGPLRELAAAVIDG